MNPLVTVGCLSFNTGKYVIEAIESVLASSYNNLQIIVVDDCSTDNVSVSVLDEYLSKYPDIVFVKNDINKGIPACFNFVLEKAKGKYLCFVCDDLISTDRINDDVEVLESLDDEYVLVHSISKTINSNGVPQNEISPNPENKMLYNDMFTINEIIKNPNINAVTTMFRVKTVRNLGGWDEKLLFEDKPFWFKICQYNKKIKFIPKINTFYRRHSQNTSTNIRYGFWIYQFQLYSNYSVHPEAQLKLRELLSLSCGSEDFNECLEIYLNSVNFSQFSYYKWRFLNYIGYHKIRSFVLNQVLRKIKILLKPS